MKDNDISERNEGQDMRLRAEFYDPFDRNFQIRRRDDPLMRLYDKKVINDDF